jgi:hypothetical protein
MGNPALSTVFMKREAERLNTEQMKFLRPLYRKRITDMFADVPGYNIYTEWSQTEYLQADTGMQVTRTKTLGTWRTNYPFKPHLERWHCSSGL